MKRLLIGLVAVISLVLANSVRCYAANDGSVGETSSGDISISLEIPSLILVDHLNDIDLTGASKYTGTTGGMSANEAFRVTGNGFTSGEYTAAITSSTGGFTLSDGNGHSIAFAFKYDDDNDASNGTTYLYGAANGGIANNSIGTNDDLDSPSGSDNAALYVSFTDAVLRAVPPGTYSATLTIVVTPE
jgi:hypothetical protein